MSGYKQMLRDRMPEMQNLALTYCKAKGRWVDYVYNNIIKKEKQCDRSNAVKKILGLKQVCKRGEVYDKLRHVYHLNVTREQVNNAPKSMLYSTFKDTIPFSRLLTEDPEMYKYWKDVVDWVEWFSKSYTSVQDTYKHAKSWNMSDTEIRTILKDKYEIDDRLVNFLIKTF